MILEAADRQRSCARLTEKCQRTFNVCVLDALVLGAGQQVSIERLANVTGRGPVVMWVGAILAAEPRVVLCYSKFEHFLRDLILELGQPAMRVRLE